MTSNRKRWAALMGIVMVLLVVSPPSVLVSVKSHYDYTNFFRFVILTQTFFRGCYAAFGLTTSSSMGISSLFKRAKR